MTEELYTAQDVADAAAAATPSVVLDGVKVAAVLYTPEDVRRSCPCPRG